MSMIKIPIKIIEMNNDKHFKFISYNILFETKNKYMPKPLNAFKINYSVFCLINLYIYFIIPK